MTFCHLELHPSLCLNMKKKNHQNGFSEHFKVATVINYLLHVGHTLLLLFSLSSSSSRPALICTDSSRKQSTAGKTNSPRWLAWVRFSVMSKVHGRGRVFPRSVVTLQRPPHQITSHHSFFFPFLPSKYFISFLHFFSPSISFFFSLHDIDAVIMSISPMWN